MIYDVYSPVHLPFNLSVEILCRLPVKHLPQLRCVCKSWNSLISQDSEFAKKHLRLSSTSNHDRRHFILATKKFLRSHEFVLCHSPLPSVFSTILTKLIRYHLLLNNVYSFSEVSTCHGMLCFWTYNSSVILCNPSIRKFKTLPPLENPVEIYSSITYTLVFDRFTNNYKIFAFSICCNNKSQVNVHTLGTDYWRRIQDFPCRSLTCDVQGIFVSDTVNWLSNDTCNSSHVTVSLDLNKESYQEVLLPNLDDRFNTSIIT